MKVLKRILAGNLAALLVAGVAIAGGPSYYGPGLTGLQAGAAETAAATYQLSTTEVTSGQKITISGSGWTTESGAGSTIVVKLKHALPGESSDTYYSRTGSDIKNHPGNGKADATIWLLFTADSSGNFSEELDLPTGLVAGQKLTVLLTSGLVDGDVQRSMTSDSLTVDGVAWEGSNVEAKNCVPSVDTPEVGVADELNEDGTLTVWGKGFCNPTLGGAVVAIKIDEGSISRLNEDLSSNVTIWAMVRGNDTNGDWSIDMVLPDGTTSLPNGSTPAFDRSATHTLRFLSGSMQDGDPIVTLPKRGSQPVSFSIGEYKPSGAPDPLDYKETLVGSAQNGVNIDPSDDSKIVVNVPNGQEGDWVYPSIYLTDNSMRYPWGGTWYQLDENLNFTLPTKDVTIPNGQLKFVVQNGNKGSLGDLVGWGWWTRSVGSNDGDPDSTSSTTPPPSDLMGYLIHGADVGADLASSVAALASMLVPTTSASAEPSSVDSPEGPATVTNVEPNITEEVVIRRSSGSGTAARVNTGGSANTASTAAAAPTTTPNLAIQEAKALRPANSGKMRAEQSDDKVTITFNEATGETAPGSWVYLYAFTPEKTDIGWTQVGPGGVLELQVGALEEDAQLAIAAPSGDLIGWTKIRATGSASSSDGSSAPIAPVVVVQQGLTSATDWIIIILSILFVEGVGYCIYLLRRRKSLRPVSNGES
ncbi:MAG: hypothetical protein Q3972_06295 [Corynebacterium sp.]|nr:hypothetical protein [Corynebacterium sp.]